MADIKLRIELNSSSETESLGSTITDNLLTANTSFPIEDSGKMNIPKREFSGSNGLSWASDYLLFTEGEMLCNPDDVNDNRFGMLESELNPKEFIWGVVPDDKKYGVKLIFSNAQNLEKITIYGDKESNQYPIEAVIDGTQIIYSDDYIWTIDLGEPSDTHTIELTKWNRSNYNAVLSLVSVFQNTFDIGKMDGLKSVDGLTQSTDRPNEIFYGAVYNTGNIEIIDKNNEISDLIIDGILPISNIKFDFFVNGKQVQELVSSDSNYDSFSKTFNVELDGKIKNWGNLDFSGMPLRMNSSLYDVLLFVLSEIQYTPDEVDEMLQSKIVFGSENFYASVKNYLQQIIIPFTYLNSGKVLDAINKICYVAQLNVVEKSDGKIMFVSARPVVDKEQGFIVIPSKNIHKATRDFIVKNKVSSVGYEDVFLSYSPKEVFSQNTNFYEQSIKSGIIELDGEETLSYSGLLSRYKESLSAENQDDFEIVGVYPAYYSGLIQENYSFFVYGIHFQSEEISMFDFFSNGFSTRQINRLGVSSLSKSSELGLLNNSETIDHSSILRDFDFVSSRDEALSNLCHFTDGNIDGVYFSSQQPKAQIIRNGNSFYIYFAVNIMAKNTSSVTNYTGELSSIVLNGTISAYTKVISELDRVVVGNRNSDYFLENNELLQNNTSFRDISVNNLISNNIIRDYQDGIQMANVSCVCADLFDNNRNISKVWSNGDILEVGDIVRIDKDNNGKSLWLDNNGKDILWRITGRRFRYSGVPMIDLELQEVKPVEIYYEAGLYDSNNNLKMGWDEVVSNFYLINDNGVLYPDGGYYEDNLSGVLRLPEEVSEIKANSFERTTALESIYFPSSVTKIGISSFASGSALESVYFKNGLVEIGGTAFGYCKIKNVHIPASTTIIGMNPFKGNDNLDKITVDSLNKVYDSRNNCNAIMETATNTLISGCRSTIIPNNTLILAENAFGGLTSITNLHLPEGLQKIEGACFDGCLGLKTMVLPESVKHIGDFAFSNCKSMTSLYIPKGVETIGFAIFAGVYKGSLTIYCGATEKPVEWDSEWNSDGGLSFHNVKWGYTKEQYEEEIKNT